MIKNCLAFCNGYVISEKEGGGGGGERGRKRSVSVYTKYKFIELGEKMFFCPIITKPHAAVFVLGADAIPCNDVCAVQIHNQGSLKICFVALKDSTANL